MTKWPRKGSEEISRNLDSALVQFGFSFTPRLQPGDRQAMLYFY